MENRFHYRKYCHCQIRQAFFCITRVPACCRHRLVAFSRYSPYTRKGLPFGISLDSTFRFNNLQKLDNEACRDCNFLGNVPSEVEFKPVRPRRQVRERRTKSSSTPNRSLGNKVWNMCDKSNTKKKKKRNKKRMELFRQRKLYTKLSLRVPSPF